MLRGQLGDVTSPEWWDNATSEQLAQNRDLADRYADVSSYANAARHNLMKEAGHRGIDPTDSPQSYRHEEGASVGPRGRDRLSEDGRVGTAPSPQAPGTDAVDGPAESPAYQRARATDMPGADTEHVQNRLDVAASFPHPIRTYTANGIKPATAALPPRLGDISSNAAGSRSLGKPLCKLRGLRPRQRTAPVTRRSH